MTTHPTSIEKSADALHHAVDSVSHAVHKTVEELNAEGAELMQRSSQTLHQQTEQLRTQFKEAREKTLDYIQHEPLKAVLIAAASGAALVLLTSWLGQRVK